MIQNNYYFGSYFDELVCLFLVLVLLFLHYHLPAHKSITHFYRKLYKVLFFFKQFLMISKLLLYRYSLHVSTSGTSLVINLTSKRTHDNLNYSWYLILNFFKIYI